MPKSSRGGRRDTISKAKDRHELSSYTKKKYGFIVGKTADGIDFGLVKESAQVMADLFDQFPQAKGIVPKLAAEGRLSANALADTYTDGTLRLSDKHYKDPSKLSATYAKTVQSGFHPRGTDVKDITAHEMGHALELALYMKAKGQRAFSWSDTHEATRIVHEAATLLNKARGTSRTIDSMVGHTSKYGLVSRSEAMAEAVADVYANGANARGLSKEIWKILKRELG